MKEDAVIPKINLNNPGPGGEPQNSGTIKTGMPVASSVLVPETSKINPLVSNTPPVNQNSQQERVFPYKKVLLGLGVFLLVLAVAIIIPGFFVYQKGLVLEKDARKLMDAGKSGNLAGMKEQLPAVKKSLASFKTSFSIFSWTRIIPFAGRFVSDAGHAVNAAQSGLEAFEVVLVTIEPYSDIFGLAAVSGEKTMQERIDFVVKTIPEVLPKLEQISLKLKEVESEISKIDASRYPEKYKGREIASNIRLAQDLISQSARFIGEGRPVLESLPFLLGMDEARNYLILFQNDKELRPTGGFLTAYALMKVEDAKFEPTVSDDIYNLDAKYKPSIEAPKPIVDYIKGPYILSKNLRLRDMNWSPSFPESMNMFSSAINEAGVKNIDGIIAVDTQLLVNLLKVIGPIGVPGFGNFSTDISPECNCPQVIHELESFADVEGPIIWDPLTGEIILKPKNSDNRKKIIGPLMNSILANAMGQPKEKLPALFEAGFLSLMEKHVLFYMFDENVQKGLSDFGLAGTIDSYEGDYLHINDANLGGRKSNLYVTQEVSQAIEVARDGSVEKTVTITYKNPEKYDGWLNSVLPNWVRIYVPKGSQLISSDGLEDKAEPYEDLDKTVFSGLFQLRPEGVAKVTFKYKLPQKFSKTFNLFIQKQPGTDAPLYTVTLGKFEEEFLLRQDREIKIKI